MRRPAHTRRRVEEFRKQCGAEPTREQRLHIEIGMLLADAETVKAEIEKLYQRYARLRRAKGLSEEQEVILEQTAFLLASASVAAIAEHLEKGPFEEN